MNAKERATQAIDQFVFYGSSYGRREPLIEAVEKAIIAAEEAKAKEEREACIEIAEALNKQRGIYNAAIKHACLHIVEQIRARSEGEKQQKGD